ncbi:MAG: F0F1 ATP synthase subunit gamma, partial [Actinobacteria bacterium]
MASAELQQLERRIKSVQSTKKITRAMELIATARIGKAQQRMSQARPYTAKMDEVIRNIAAATGGLRHPLLERRPARTAGIVIVTSDRGLAGAYNHSVIRLAEHAISAHRSEGREVGLYVVGKKAQTYFRYRRFQIERAWLGVTDTPRYGDARSVAQILLNEYIDGAVDSVEMYTTRYVSALTQSPGMWPLLPIEPPVAATPGGAPVAYTFEP